MRCNMAGIITMIVKCKLNPEISLKSSSLIGGKLGAF